MLKTLPPKVLFEINDFFVFREEIFTVFIRPLIPDAIIALMYLSEFSRIGTVFFFALVTPVLLVILAFFKLLRFFVDAAFFSLC